MTIRLVGPGCRQLATYGALVACSSHLPPAPGAMLDLFLGSLAMVPAADPFVGPDHAALEAMLAGMAADPASPTI